MKASAQINVYHTLITDDNTRKQENKQAWICMHTSSTQWMTHSHKAVVEKLETCEESRQSCQLNCGGGHNAQETCTQGMDAYSDDCSW